ncbi:hypothetical protein [Candidatus Cyanaurora vandensis]|uniref:hypothetical protein n=1 Tax=Candidatus Cyanaurora vandensis TaxID=2714958 RepID=UPI00257C8020|nr:hypothetical protein [Candidatus Cyanaurora vandensis]
MASARRLPFHHPVAWLVATLLLSSGLYWGSSALIPNLNPQQPLVQEAQQRLKLYLADYAQQLNSYNAALQAGDGPALARTDTFLGGQRQQFALVLGGYLAVLAKLPPSEPLVVKLQALAPDAQFQFAYTSLGPQGSLIQVSVTENEFDVRHLALWQRGERVLALNNYETEWQAQVNAVRYFTRNKQRFLIAKGQTRQLEDTAPFLKVYQEVGADLLDKTADYLPLELLDTFGTGEFLGQTANLKLDTVLLDPERIMAACDSCGLVSQRALWQWTDQGYQLVDRQILNQPENALYAALVTLVKQQAAPAWTRAFLTSRVRAMLQQAPSFEAPRYTPLEQGLAVTDTQPWQEKGFQYTVEGPFQFKVQVRQDPQGQWQTIQIRDLKRQAPGWSIPYTRQPLAS